MKNKKINAGQYVDQTALLLNLELRDEHRDKSGGHAQSDRVIENFEKIQVIAKLVNEFPLPEDIQAAPKFEP